MKRIVLPLLAAFGLAGAAEAQEMEPGEWQFNSTVTSPMFPGPQTTTITRCVRKEDTADPSRWMGNQPDQECKTTLGARSGESQSFEFACPKSGMKGKGTVRYGRGAIETDMQVAGNVQGQAFEMRTKMTGKRLGACKS